MCQLWATMSDKKSLPLMKIVSNDPSSGGHQLEGGRVISGFEGINVGVLRSLLATTEGKKGINNAAPPALFIRGT